MLFWLNHGMTGPELYSCTCGGIHPCWVEPVSPIELTTSRHPVLSPSCVAEDSRSGEGIQGCIDRGCSSLQLVSSSAVQRARRCGQKEVLNQLTVRASCISIMSSALIVEIIHY